MKRTGEILKKAREQKGLSINEIALSLKISSKILKAIEDGDLSQLPAKTFLRGFVQSYANYLRVDVNEIMRLFQEEMGSTRPTPLINMPARDETLEANDIATTPTTSPASTKSDPSSDKPLNSLAKSNNSRTITLTVLGFVLVGLIIFTKKMIDKYQKEGAVSEVEVTTPIATPVNNNVTPTPQAGNSPFAEAAPAAMSTPLATPTPSHTPAPTLTPKPAATPKSANSPTPTPAATATATATPKPTATPTPSPSPSPSVSPSPSPAEKLNKPVEVIIEALDAVEIDFSTKDGKSEKVSLTAEQVHTFKSKNGLKLNISNGGAVNVIVNGKDLGIPGNLGKPVKLSY